MGRGYETGYERRLHRRKVLSLSLLLSPSLSFWLSILHFSPSPSISYFFLSPSHKFTSHSCLSLFPLSFLPHLSPTFSMSHFFALPPRSLLYPSLPLFHSRSILSLLHPLTSSLFLPLSQFLFLFPSVSTNVVPLRYLSDQQNDYYLVYLFTELALK